MGKVSRQSHSENEEFVVRLPSYFMCPRTQYCVLETVMSGCSLYFRHAGTLDTRKYRVLSVVNVVSCTRLSASCHTNQGRSSR